jgi:hypothetical protein
MRTGVSCFSDALSFPDAPVDSADIQTSKN